MANVWIASKLSVELFGLWSLLFSIQIGVISFSTTGVYEATASLLKDCETSYDRYHLYKSAIFSYIGIAALTSIFFFSYYFLASDNYINIYVFLSVLFNGVTLSYFFVISCFVRLEELHQKSLIFSFSFPFIIFIFSILFFYKFENVESYFYGSVLGAIFSIALYLKYFHIKIKINKSQKNNIINIYKRLPPYFIIVIFSWFSGYGLNLVIPKFFTIGAVATYTMSFNISSILLVLASSINQVTSPYILKRISNGEFEFNQNLFIRFYYIMATILGLVSLFIIIIIPTLFQYIGGGLSEFIDIKNRVIFLCLGYILLIPWWQKVNYFYAYDRGDLIMKISITSGLIGILIWFLCIYYIGEIGIYVGFMLQMFIRSILMSIVCRKKWGINLQWKPTILGLIIPICGYLFYFYGP